MSHLRHIADKIRYPAGFGPEDTVTWGNDGLVSLDKASHTVVKSPHAKDGTEDALAMEKMIYERFSERGGHEGLLRYHGPYGSGIRLEFACNRDLRSFLEKHANDFDFDQRLLWAGQLANALRFVHSANVIHGDLTWTNVFLDEHLNVKVADFGGSSLDGSPLLVEVAPWHRYPGPALSIQADIFALASTLYEIMTGTEPYHQLPFEEIQARYARGEFPETSRLGSIGDIIARCWRGQYENVDAIAVDIKGVYALQYCRLRLMSGIKRDQSLESWPFFNHFS